MTLPESIILSRYDPRRILRRWAGADEVEPELRRISQELLNAVAPGEALGLGSLPPPALPLGETVVVALELQEDLDYHGQTLRSRFRPLDSWVREGRSGS